MSDITLLAEANHTSNAKGPFTGYGAAVDVTNCAILRLNLAMADRAEFPSWQLKLWLEQSSNGTTWRKLRDLGTYRPQHADQRYVVTEFDDFVRAGYTVSGYGDPTNPLYPDSTRQGPVFSLTGTAEPDAA